MMQRRRSHLDFERAKRSIPGGVNSPARAFGAVGGEPIFFASGSGARLTDVDRNECVDFVGSWGALIFGHADSAVVEAVQKAAARGTSFGAPTEAENELAELIVDAVPSIERVRLVNSGTEATMSAVRLARGFTGRDRIVKFRGNYHGHVDSLLVSAGSAATSLGAPDSPGVPAASAADTIVVEYNDSDGLEMAFSEFGDTIAAVVVEPIAGNMGVVLPSAEFRRALRDLTRENGSLLIFDEVITGFRVAFGGAQSMMDLAPDLTALGKIIGGGLPVGAYGGRSDIMRFVLPEGKVFQAGTLSGNPLATAAGIATLRRLRDDPPYARLEVLAARLERGIRDAAVAHGIEQTIGRVGSMMTLFFGRDRILNWSAALRCDTERYGRWFWKMIDQGVYLPCSQFEALFVSTAHTEEDIDLAVAAANSAMAKL